MTRVNDVNSATTDLRFTARLPVGWRGHSDTFTARSATQIRLRDLKGRNDVIASVPVDASVWTDNGSKVAAWCQESLSITVCDMQPSGESGKSARTARPPAVCTLSDNTSLVSASEDGTVRVWNCSQPASDRVCLFETVSAAPVLGLTVSADGRTALTTHRDSLGVWDTRTGTLKNPYVVPGVTFALTAAISPDASRVYAMGKKDGNAVCGILDLVKGAENFRELRMQSLAYDKATCKLRKDDVVTIPITRNPGVWEVPHQVRFDQPLPERLQEFGMKMVSSCWST